MKGRIAFWVHLVSGMDPVPCSFPQCRRSAVDPRAWRPFSEAAKARPRVRPVPHRSHRNPAERQMAHRGHRRRMRFFLRLPSAAMHVLSLLRQLWDVFSGSEAAQLIAEQSSAESAAKLLLHRALGIFLWVWIPANGILPSSYSTRRITQVHGQYYHYRRATELSTAGVRL